VADFAPVQAAEAADFADAVGREVVVEGEPLGGVPAGQAVEVLLVAAGPERDHGHRLGLAAGEQGRTVHARQDAHIRHQRAQLIHRATVHALAFFQDALSDDLDFHHVEELLEQLVRHDLFAVDLLHPGKGGVEHLGHLGLALELFDGEEGFFEIGAGKFAQLGDLLGVRQRFGERLGGQAHFFAQLGLGVADPGDGFVAELHGGDHVVVGHFQRGSFDHDRQVAAAHVDQINVGVLHLDVSGVQQELAVDAADAHGADGAKERQFAEHEGRGGGIDAEDVALMFAIHGEQGVVDLDLVVEAFGEEGPNRAVGHARREDFLLGGASFALEVAAGEASRRVEPFAVFHLQREEINAFARLLGVGDGGEHHGFAELAGGLSGRLAGQQTRFERHRFLAEGDADGGRILHFLLSFFLAVFFCLVTWMREGARGGRAVAAQ